MATMSFQPYQRELRIISTTVSTDIIDMTAIAAMSGSGPGSAWMPVGSAGLTIAPPTAKKTKNKTARRTNRSPSQAQRAAAEIEFVVMNVFLFLTVVALIASRRILLSAERPG